MRNFEVSIEDEYGNTMPAQKNKKSNRVFSGLLNRLEEFFENEDLKVYKLFIDPAWVGEFAWEQYFFQKGNEFYVLSFYQEGLV
jgi:ribosomal protein L22